MNGYGGNYSSDEHQPVMYVRGYPLYAAHFIVAVYVVTFIVCGLASAAGGIGFLTLLVFDSTRVLQGEVWRIFSYGLVNLPQARDVWVLVELLMLAQFGREVEKVFGRATFLKLYACLYLLPPLLFTALGFWWPTMLAGGTAGFAIFIAFAALYPDAALLFNILAKWAAIALVAFYSLQGVAAKDWVHLLSLWATVGFAYGFTRHQQGRFSFPAAIVFKRKPRLRVLPDLPAEKPEPRRGAKPESMVEIDALLDKIATSGIGSLTAKERARLDAARDNLKKRDLGR
jgi:hypothetical protein